MYNFLLGRLYLTNEAARDTVPSDELLALAEQKPFHVGNKLGLPGYGADHHENAMLDKTIAQRIASTRDDPRYDEWMEKYGEEALNYSARPASKSGKGFSKERAIGVAWKESGIFSNIMALSTMFSMGKIGEGVEEPSAAAVEKIKQWKKRDYSMQQRLTAGALICNYVNVKEKCALGGIEYSENDKGAFFTKGKATVPLNVLANAYENKQGKREDSYTDRATGVEFNGADLVMAHLAQQYRLMKNGLLAVYPGAKKDLLELFDPAHRPDIAHTKALYDNILHRLHEMKSVREAEKPKDLELLKGAYALLFESGNGIFPLSALQEEGLHQEALKRHPRVNAEQPQTTISA
jgi:hypothetical protein